MERARRVIERKAMEREKETLQDKMRYNVVDEKKRYCLKMPPPPFLFCLTIMSVLSPRHAEVK